VWHEGLSEWQKAETINELQELFKSIPPPPPNHYTIMPPSLPNTKIDQQYIQPEYHSDAKKILGIKRNYFFYGMLAVALVIGGTAFNSKKKNDLEQGIQQQQIESYNVQLEEQQKAIEEQNKRIAEQERLERERINREKKAALEKRINEITNELNYSYQNLEQAKRHLHDVSAFKVLRTSSERHEQVSAAENQVKMWENNIEKLEKEMQKINPEWGS